MSNLIWRRKLILIIAAKQTELFSIMCTPKTLFRMSLFYWELVKLNPENRKKPDLDFECKTESKDLLRKEMS